MSDTNSAGTVSVAVKPDTKNFGSDLKTGIMGGASGVGENLGGMILGGLKTMAGPIAAVTAAFSVKHVLEDSMKAFEDYAGTVRGMQRITGGSVEEVSGLAGAMKLAGVNAEDVTGAMTKFSANMGKAGADAKKTAAMNDLFGQSIKDAQGNVKPMAELLPGLADKFAAMPDGANKTALAVSLFGRAGAQMIPVLNKGSAGIGELTDKASKMGLTLSGEAMDGFLESKKSARDFNAAISGLKITMGSELVPVVDAVQNIFRNAMAPAIQAVTGFLNSHREAFAKLAEGITDFGGKANGALAGTFKSIGEAFSKLGPVIGDLLPQLMELFSALSPVHLIFQALQPVLPALIDLVVKLAVSLGGTLAGVLKEILPPITDVVKILVGVLSGVIIQLMPVITELAKMFGTYLGQVVKDLAPIVVVLVQAIASLIPPLAPLITQIISLAISAIIPLAKAIMPLIVTLLPVLVDLIQFLVPIVKFLAQVIEAVLVVAIQVAINILSVIVKSVTGLITWFSNLITSVVHLGGKIGSVFGDIGDAIGGAFSSAVGIVKGAINHIIDLVNGAIGAINGLAKGVKQLTGGAINLSIPTLPHLAQGGIVPATPGGRLVQVAEGGEAEAVIPLSKLGGLGNGSTVNYYAAPNDSITSEQKLVTAVQRARVLAWT